MTKSLLSRRTFMATSAALATLAVTSRTATSQSSPIKIGIGSDPSFSAFYLAAQEKLFAAEGVDVAVQNYTDGGTSMDALVAGQVDLACSSEPTSMIRLARAELRPLAVFFESETLITMVIGSKIADPSQIKRLGMVPGSISEYCTRLAIAKLKLKESELTLVKAGPPEMPALLARDAIDGYFVWEPWPTMGVKQGGKIVMTSADVGYTATQWITATVPFFNSNPAGAKAVLRALAKASDIVTSEPNRAAAAVKSQTHIPEETTLGMLTKFKAEVRDFTDTDYKSYDGIAQFLADAKLTKEVLPYRNFLQRGFYKA